MLTEAVIQETASLHDKVLSLSLSNFKKLEKFPYLLLIKSTTEDIVKITIYPLQKEKILKISVLGKEIPKEKIISFLDLLQNHEILHSSGLCVDSNEQLLYECYLNLNFSDPQSKILKQSLEKITGVFENIILEEITLIKQI